MQSGGAWMSDMPAVPMRSGVESRADERDTISGPAGVAEAEAEAEAEAGAGAGAVAVAPLCSMNELRSGRLAVSRHCTPARPRRPAPGAIPGAVNRGAHRPGPRLVLAVRRTLNGAGQLTSSRWVGVGRTAAERYRTAEAPTGVPYSYS